jgi:hypothetical protein
MSYGILTNRIQFAKMLFFYQFTLALMHLDVQVFKAVYMLTFLKLSLISLHYFPWERINAGC